MLHRKRPARWIGTVMAAMVLAAASAYVVTNVRGQFGRLGPFRGESEYSGLVFGEDSTDDHAFELRAGAFDVLR